MEQTLTAKEVAEIMRLSPAGLRNMAKQGRLPFRVIRLGSAYRFPRAEVMAYVNGDAGNEDSRAN
jgi:excisionase family DNA binding protein